MSISVPSDAGVQSADARAVTRGHSSRPGEPLEPQPGQEEGWVTLPGPVGRVAPPEEPVKADDVTEPNRVVREPEDTRMSSIVFSPAGDGTMYAAGRNRECATQVGCPAVLFRSTDGGASWTRLLAQGFDGRSLLLPPAFGTGDDRIFAMSHAGVLQVSEDGGQTFGPATGTQQFDGAVDISPGFNSGDPRIIIGTQSSLAQYNDDTKTISPAPYSSLPGTLEPAFVTPDLLIVGGRQTNESRQWGAAVYRCEESLCRSTRVSDDPVPPKIRLDRGLGESSPVYAFTDKDLFRSEDGGVSFARMNKPSGSGLLVDVALASGGQQLFAAVWSHDLTGDAGLYVSSDGGASWERLPDPIFDAGASIVATSGDRVLVGLGNGGAACSSDLGLTWSARC